VSTLTELAQRVRSCPAWCVPAQHDTAMVFAKRILSELG
jgi:hypothetical protein